MCAKFQFLFENEKRGVSPPVRAKLQVKNDEKITRKEKNGLEMIGRWHW